MSIFSLRWHAPIGFFTVVLMLNVAWFGMGAWYFGLKHLAAAKLIVPRAARDSPLFATLAASVRFLGGLNLAMAVFAALLLACGAMFPLPGQHALFAAVFAVGHGSQFAANLPVLRARTRQPDTLWPVLTGPMRLIFLVDFALMLANAAAACVLYLHPAFS